jgi:hypothetical protein
VYADTLMGITCSPYIRRPITLAAVCGGQQCQLCL